MELFTLDGAFQLYDLIENYKSLVWTERYSSSGDFELKSNEVAATIKQLPLESFVTLRESTVPMIVEAHKIEKKKNAAPEITVTGRSFETVLERRASVQLIASDASKQVWTISANKPSDAAFMMMRTVLGDGPVYVSGFEVLPGRLPAVSEHDAIPEISLTKPSDYSLPEWNKNYSYSKGDVVGVYDYMYISLADENLNHDPRYVTQGLWEYFSTSGALPPEGPVASYLYSIEVKDLYSSALDLIAQNHRGLKAVRPTTAGTQVGIEIYNGADLTSTVVFDVKFDQIDEAAYLLSFAGSTNIAYTYGWGGANIVSKTGDPDAPLWSATTVYSIGDRVNHRGVTYESGLNSNLNSEPYMWGSMPTVGSGGGSNYLPWYVYEPYVGLNRRVLVVDQSENEALPSNTDYTLAELRRAKSLIELYKYNATALFDGSVSEQVAAGYNVDYNLGDILMIKGDYDLSEKVRVAEFIRSSDSSGEKAYPTFETVAE